MMKTNRVWAASKVGLETLLLSIQFFYGHLTLIIISLVPSLIRAFQMWNIDTSIWLEVIVELIRVALFLLMISLMTKNSIGVLRKKSFWLELSNRCSIQFKKTWPYVFVAQIIVFIVFLYGVGNLLIILISEIFIPSIGMLGVHPPNPTAAYNSCVYFLKNMSIIPIAFVFILKMCGVKGNG